MIDSLVISPGYTYARKVDDQLGCLGIPECWVTSSEECLDYMRGRDNWKALKILAMLRSERRIGDKVESKTRYFISSVQMNAKTFLEAKCRHWGIENQLHWVLGHRLS